MERRPEPSQEDLENALRMPQDRPFTYAQARDLGIARRQLMRLLELGLIRRPFKGVYVAASLDDTMALRLAVLTLVVPPDCVVTDLTAGWLWAGDRMLAPNSHLVTPVLSVYCKPGHRLRSKLTDSGERRFSPDDLVEVQGLVVSAPLRTACDCGRLLHRDQAFAALDTLAATGAFTVDELLAEVNRFKGYRGVIQLRSFAPLTDPRSDSQSESVLRLRWHDACLPRPECQVEAETPWGTPYRVDVGRPEEQFGAEYFGEEFHGQDRAEHDQGRLSWLEREGGWTIVVARKHNVYGRHQDIVDILTEKWRLAEVKRRRPA
jgi:putative AbiEi antitoxin of type IV toxin-antitoxin system